MIWLVLLTILAVGWGLLVAILFDRVRYESLAKSLVFMPLAISFVGAGVIWKFMFDYKPAGATQIGTLNAALDGFGLDPVAWLQNAPLEHPHADHRGDVDLDRLLHGHPVRPR